MRGALPAANRAFRLAELAEHMSALLRKGAAACTQMLECSALHSDAIAAEPPQLSTRLCPSIQTAAVVPVCFLCVPGVLWQLLLLQVPGSCPRFGSLRSLCCLLRPVLVKNTLLENVRTAAPFTRQLVQWFFGSVTHTATWVPAGHYSEEKPFWATLKESRLLTSADCGKRVIHAVFDVADAGMQFAAGDAFTVHPSNDPKLVTELLEHLMEDGSQYALEFGPC